MYLSKLKLNERNSKVRADLSNAHNLHRSIMQAFPDEHRNRSRADWNILFRQEPDSDVILVQSDVDVEPDWNRLPDEYLTHIPQVELLSRYFQRSVNSYSDSFNLHSQLLSFTENKCGSLSNSLTF